MKSIHVSDEVYDQLALRSGYEDKVEGYIVHLMCLEEAINAQIQKYDEYLATVEGEL